MNFPWTIKKSINPKHLLIVDSESNVVVLLYADSEEVARVIIRQLTNNVNIKESE